MFNLLEKLKEVKDFRKDQGKRHPLYVILFIVIIATMSGYIGYRAWGEFAKANQKEISETLSLNPSKVCSYSTIRRAIKCVDTANLLLIFNQWAAETYRENIDTKILAIDGKILRNTVVSPNEEGQNHVKFVSLFSCESNLVLHLQPLENKKGSEIAAFVDIVRNCQLQNKIFTGDSLHCQTKTIATIIETNNDYVIAVKKNQPNLYRHLESISRNEQSLSTVVEKDFSHGRKITREVSVFEFRENQKKAWGSGQSIVKVTRSGERNKKHYEQVSYYLSSIRESAETFAQIIRGHWGIENQLHWVKDVILGEDKSRIKEFTAATNISILQTLALNLLRSAGLTSVTQGQRWLANKWERSMIILT